MSDLLERAAAWEERYAARSRITVTELRDAGRIVATCDCDDRSCEGFQSLSESLLRVYRDELGRPWERVLP